VILNTQVDIEQNANPLQPGSGVYICGVITEFT